MDAFPGFDGEWEFKVGYWVTITATQIVTQDGEEPYLSVAKEKHGP